MLASTDKHEEERRWVFDFGCLVSVFWFRAKNWYGVDTLREQQKTAMVDDSLPTAEEQGEQSVNGKEDDKKNAATKTSMKKNEGECLTLGV